MTMHNDIQMEYLLEKPTSQDERNHQLEIYFLAF